MLQRIYGTAWESAAQLAAYETLKVEAARRDHRKLGQELDLFSIQEGTGGRDAGTTNPQEFEVCVGRCQVHGLMCAMDPRSAIMCVGWPVCCGIC